MDNDFILGNIILSQTNNFTIDDVTHIVAQFNINKIEVKNKIILLRDNGLLNEFGSWYKVNKFYK
jgi:hypothetical protein